MKRHESKIELPYLASSSFHAKLWTVWQDYLNKQPQNLWKMSAIPPAIVSSSNEMSVHERRLKFCGRNVDWPVIHTSYTPLTEGGFPDSQKNRKREMPNIFWHWRIPPTKTLWVRHAFLPQEQERCYWIAREKNTFIVKNGLCLFYRLYPFSRAF